MANRHEELTAYVQRQTQDRFDANISRIRMARAQQGLEVTADDRFFAAEMACMNRQARRRWARRFRR